MHRKKYQGSPPQLKVTEPSLTPSNGESGYGLQIPTLQIQPTTPTNAGSQVVTQMLSQLSMDELSSSSSSSLTDKSLLQFEIETSGIRELSPRMDPALKIKSPRSEATIGAPKRPISTPTLEVPLPTYGNTSHSPPNTFTLFQNSSKSSQFIRSISPVSLSSSPSSSPLRLSPITVPQDAYKKKQSSSDFDSSEDIDTRSDSSLTDEFFGMDDIEYSAKREYSAYGNPSLSHSLPAPIGHSRRPTPQNLYHGPSTVPFIVELEKPIPDYPSYSYPEYPNHFDNFSSSAPSPQIMYSPSDESHLQGAAAAQQAAGYAEHPLGEHPSRTLFVRNISSTVDDEELRNLFEAYGAIRSMYTQCKHRGFVMISYHDIRHAKNAMKNLQHKIIKRRKIDIHYSIPKENPTEKDLNQGTLVVFNLDPTITNEELKKVFSKYGEIKEIRETPNKKHHKFIEFYDTRDADRAMKHLNKTEIRGKKIKIEPSRPGGARRTLMQHWPGDVSGNPSTSTEPSLESMMVQYEATHFPQDTHASNMHSNQTGTQQFPTQQSPTQQFLTQQSPTQQFLTQQSPTQQSPTRYLLSAISTTPPLADTPLNGNAFHKNSGTMSDSPTATTIMSSSPSEGLLSTSASSTTSTSSNGSSSERKGRGPNKQSSNDRKQFMLDLEKVRLGVDKRTTLMVKNIPNKYTQKMLLQTIDIKFKGQYDFFYLPIDFKNKCNVGYAFINFINPLSIYGFSEEFNGKKWEKFNSDKVCELTYARIQGKPALVQHFQNSSLMVEDPSCRPIFIKE